MSFLDYCNGKPRLDEQQRTDCLNREMPVQEGNMIVDIDKLKDDDPLKDLATKMFEQEFPKPLKFDNGKLRLDLIPTTAYNSLGSVLTFGANKYSANSWIGVERERYIAALLRHLVAYLDDPQGKDEESGLLHSEHMLCNAMFLNHFACKGKEKSE